MRLTLWAGTYRYQTTDPDRYAVKNLSFFIGYSYKI